MALCAMARIGMAGVGAKVSGKRWSDLLAFASPLPRQTGADNTGMMLTAG